MLQVGDIMPIINEITKEAEDYYKRTGKIPKKLYLDVETYIDFITEVHEKYSYFFAMNGNKDPLYFNSMEIIKIKNWRIE